jgi:hypothetical protein
MVSYKTITVKSLNRARTIEGLRKTVQFFLHNNKDRDNCCEGEAIHYLKACVAKYKEICGNYPSEDLASGSCCAKQGCWVRTLAGYEDADLLPCFDGKTNLADSILQKWRAQGFFVRFNNGDKADCRIDNLEFVKLKDAVENIGTWTTDWDMKLTEEEKALVMDATWRSGLSIVE